MPDDTPEPEPERTPIVLDEHHVLLPGRRHYAYGVATSGGKIGAQRVSDVESIRHAHAPWCGGPCCPRPGAAS